MEALAQALEHQRAFFLGAVGLIGLLVGSFLNVVIHRLPIMLERAWRQECREFLGLEPEAAKPYNLLLPRSHCPACGKPIGFWENIPVASYLALGGRCLGCGARISLRYVLVELLTAALSVAVAWRFGVSLQTAAALALTFGLIALSFIDLDQQLLPDAIVLPLLWLGLFLTLFQVFTDSASGVLGAISGYLSLWTVHRLFKWITGKDGMGQGDFKLLALLGAWLGWTKLPAVILLSSLAGAAVGLTMVVAMGRDRHLPIAYGPYLAAAGWIALLWGDAITGAYLEVLGIPA
ncbi:prepilin peptidase [Candidatus Methylocalor cossyra]|uniref:Prepilin leader peptidase/N-methyltransferase n=1 Tax=Candidatus Methylocalor cossyra TaxID=3108543 RepID=A0ABM9NEZ2_9GAMM